MQPMRTCKGLQPSIIGRTGLDRLCSTILMSGNVTDLVRRSVKSKLTPPQGWRHIAVYSTSYLTTLLTTRQELGHRKQDTGHRTQDTGHRKQEISFAKTVGILSPPVSEASSFDTARTSCFLPQGSLPAPLQTLCPLTSPSILMIHVVHDHHRCNV